MRLLFQHRHRFRPGKPGFQGSVTVGVIMLRPPVHYRLSLKLVVANIATNGDLPVANHRKRAMALHP